MQYTTIKSYKTDARVHAFLTLNYHKVKVTKSVAPEQLIPNSMLILDYNLLTLL